MSASANADLELMRAAALLDSDPQAAARAAQSVLNTFPGHEQAGLLLAAALRKSGDAGAAAPLVEALATGKADSPVLQLELGRNCAAAGRHEAALAAFRKAVELEPNFADGWRELAAQCFAVGDVRNGDLAHWKFETLAADPPELTDAKVAMAQGRLDAAASMLQDRLQRQPQDAVAWRLSADVAGRLGYTSTAESRLRQALALAPGYAAARFDLAVLLHLQERTEEALPLIERLLAVAPDDVHYLALKARAIRFLGNHEAAIDIASRLVRDHPSDPEHWLLLGNLSREFGDATRAVESYRRSLALRPGFGEAYWRLANLKTLRFSEQDLADMERQLDASPALGMDRTYLEFALGKAYEDVGRYAESFDHYQRGNARHRMAMPHDSSLIVADVERSLAMYTPAFFTARRGWGSQQRDPIFIVGLPRSGSTLLEQILASHSQVEGTRELTYLPAMVSDLTDGAGGKDGYPLCIAPLTGQDIAGLAAKYLAQAGTHRRAGRPRFVDKMLGNFGHVGLIHLMFPRAAIIDARRHPLGLGFSCFKQLFNRGLSFSYDLRDIGVQYREYARLMAHIDAVLPGRVHRVHYEKLVADPGTEVRRLLDYCGLPFEEECLRFHQNRRTVMTISSEQVRTPIYADGVEQWRHFEPWLGELKAELGELIARYP